MKGITKFINFLKKNYILLIIIFFLIAVIFYSYYSKGVVYSIASSDSDSLIEYIYSFGNFSYPIFILLVILEVVLAPIPALALYMVGGALFGTALGGALTLIGNLIGAIIAFWIARRFGRKFVEKTIDPEARKKFDNFAEKYGGFSLFFLRINPFTTSDIFSYISGLSKMKVGTFILGTGLGLAPMIFLQAYFGEAFIKTHHILYVILIWISVAYLLAFVYIIMRTLLKKKNVSHDISKEETLILPKEI